MQEIVNIKQERFNHWTIHTEIDIKAPTKEVWQVLTDFDKMSSWSTTFQNFEGDFRDGGNITVSVKAGGRITQVKHKIFLEDEQYFGWNDTRLAGAGDNHIYKVEDLGKRNSRFIHTDKLEGGMAWLLAPLMFNFIVKNLYMTFNRELKAQVEKSVG